MSRLRDHVDWTRVFVLLLPVAITLHGLSTFAMLNRLGHATFAAGFPPEWLDYLIAAPLLLLVLGLCFETGYRAGLSQGRAENIK